MEHLSQCVAKPCDEVARRDALDFDDEFPLLVLYEQVHGSRIFEHSRALRGGDNGVTRKALCDRHGRE